MALYLQVSYVLRRPIGSAAELERVAGEAEAGEKFLGSLSTLADRLAMRK